ncbi:S-layer homology domain-containing protein [Oscillibacter sp.]|uniref:S-layer homology domain-containing protein n=1 Tax=Oscillibacter sp. TaxID=1945593 RepID=UPI00289BEC53|nr:S-layer homology domain-containing protein [Oscillibacter sp.]
MKASLKKRAARVLFLALAVCLLSVPAGAKTISSERGNNIFFYATNASGKSVLLKVLPLSDLKVLTHGTEEGTNYYISSTDNYPTTQYCEARGFTIPELVDCVKEKTGVSGAAELSFSGTDKIQLMATDSYGTYSRVWTYDQLYGVKRYYFEGLYDREQGWNTGWEVGGEDNSKFGIDLPTYQKDYQSKDPYYADKRAAFDTGRETTVILATESLSGRTTTDTLNASTELGLGSYIESNKGSVTGCLAKNLTDDTALRLSLPMTEADLMAAHRTAYDNFKWIYNLRLDMTKAPALRSAGTVADPVARFTKSADGKTLTIALTCATTGATIYYSYDGAPQIPYTGPVTYDISGRDLSASPVTMYATAVKEGWDDGGVIFMKYPGLAPAFQALYSSMANENVVFQAAAGVSSAEWTAWTGAMNFITVKTPEVNGYITVSPSEYKAGAASFTFDKSLFGKTGAYSFIFHATKYADKQVSLTIKKAAPTVKTQGSYGLGSAMTLRFDDAEYQSGLSVYILDSNGTRILIPSSGLDRSVVGQVTVKAEYFALASCPIQAAGTYTLELDNSLYAPGSQTVNVAVAKLMETGFSDVAGDAWCANAVVYAVQNGLFNGTAPGLFSPNSSMTRGMFVTVLGRLDGVAADTISAPAYSDVAQDSVYAPYIAWAAENGLAAGYRDGTFRPNVSVTREQIAAIFYRYAQFKGEKTNNTDSAAFNAFSDGADVGAYALDAMRWATAAGVVNGGGGRLNPKGTASRAHVAQMMLNYHTYREGEHT